MSKIKGLDHGNQFIKDNDMHIFKSAYSRTDSSLAYDNKIIINGVDYYYGKGDILVDRDRIDSEINFVCTLANIALSGGGDIYLVCGLPIETYQLNNNKFFNTIMSYNNNEVVYKDKKINFHIEDVTIFAQGAGVLFNYPIPDGVYIIFDVGSYTINVVMIELINGIPSILKFNTWYDGVLTFYENVINEIKRREGLTLDLSDYSTIEKYGLSVRGVKKDTKFIDLMKIDYLNNILTKFKLNYKSYETTPILLCGGGGSFLQKLFEGYLNNAILMPDSQFANAIGYYNFGLQKYCSYVGGV